MRCRFWRPLLRFGLERRRLKNKESYIMNQAILDNNYLFVPEFLTVQEANSLYKEFKIQTQLYPNNFNKVDSQVPGSPSIHNYVPFVALLCEKTAHMNELISEKLLPTYAYARMYKNGAELKKHTDRPACEISVTLNLGSDGTSWPICFTKPDGSTVAKDLKPGEAVIYLGCVSEHWREGVFEGQEYGQVFLHYVRSKGNYINHCFDGARK
jgi:hypothetical protein